MRISAEDVFNGASVRNVQHYYVNSITVARVAIFREVPRAKRCPLVDVDCRRRDNYKQSSVRCEKMAQPAQGIRFCLIRWDIVKGEGSENHVKPAWRELAASVITDRKSVV